MASNKPGKQNPPNPWLTQGQSNKRIRGGSGDESVNDEVFTYVNSIKDQSVMADQVDKLFSSDLFVNTLQVKWIFPTSFNGRLISYELMWKLSLSASRTWNSIHGVTV